MAWAQRCFVLMLQLAGAMNADAGSVDQLAAYTIDESGVTVSGVSSGGYMAQQLHVAYSSLIGGAAIIAGGPYHCAGGSYPFNMLIAMDRCMDATDGVPFFGPPGVEASISETHQAFGRGVIDDPSNLSGDQVWLFSGASDTTVPRAVMDVVADYYHRFSAQVTYITDLAAGHAMITATDGANACDATREPFINDCDYDAAGALLKTLYGTLKQPLTWNQTSLLAFDQSEFIDDPEVHGMAQVGYLYVPQNCAGQQRCRLHVALHGCGQTEDDIGDAFYTQTGYNDWAEANDIVILYPQAAARTWFLLPWPNPEGCWDWWGYTGRQYHTQRGVQMRAIKAMVERLTGH
jgi:poly(3-hydroxybutyrate) depolymerase